MSTPAGRAACTAAPPANKPKHWRREIVTVQVYLEEEAHETANCGAAALRGNSGCRRRGSGPLVSSQAARRTQTGVHLLSRRSVASGQGRNACGGALPAVPQVHARGVRSAKE